MLEAENLELSVVLPAFQEEENLRLLLPRLNSVLRGMGVSHEVLIIDTEQPLDHTDQACAEFGAIHVPREGGNSFGCAVRTGIARAQGQFIIFMDADGSHTPEYIPELYSFRKDYGVVVASRYVAGGSTENSASLILMSRILNLTYRLILNLKCNDVSTSFKLYDAQLLKPLILKSDNFDIIEEILFKIARTEKDLRIKEVPSTFKKRMFGETKRKLLWFMITYFWTMAKLRMSVMVPFKKTVTRARARFAR